MKDAHIYTWLSSLNNCSLIRIPHFSWNMVYVYLILKRTVYIVGISTVFVWQNLFFQRRKKYNGLCNLFALKDINEIYHIKIISLIIFIVLKIFEFHPLLMTRCSGLLWTLYTILLYRPCSLSLFIYLAFVCPLNNYYYVETILVFILFLVTNL